MTNIIPGFLYKSGYRIIEANCKSTGGTGFGSLSQLSDVALDSADHQDLFMYDGVMEKWRDATVAEVAAGNADNSLQVGFAPSALGVNSTAIGTVSQGAPIGANTTTLGYFSGGLLAGAQSTIVGASAGDGFAGAGSCLFGFEAGKGGTSETGTHVGYQSGNQEPGPNSCTLGAHSQSHGFSSNVVVGASASAADDSVAVGRDVSAVHDNSLIIASVIGGGETDQQNACYLKPIRPGNGEDILHYDDVSGEIAKYVAPLRTCARYKPQQPALYGSRLTDQVVVDGDVIDTGDHDVINNMFYEDSGQEGRWVCEQAGLFFIHASIVLAPPISNAAAPHNENLLVISVNDVERGISNVRYNNIFSVDECRRTGTVTAVVYLNIDDWFEVKMLRCNEFVINQNELRVYRI